VRLERRLNVGRGEEIGHVHGYPVGIDREVELDRDRERRTEDKTAQLKLETQERRNRQRERERYRRVSNYITHPRANYFEFAALLFIIISLISRNLFLGRGLVNMSACWARVGTHFISMKPFWMHSLIK
jgi:hypothetical protein